MATETVFINGKKFRPEDAVVSVFDRGFLFGDAIYEVTRSYGNVLFQIEEHVSRLFRSAARIQMHLVRSETEMLTHLYKLSEQHGASDVYMRVQISRGSGPIGLPIENAGEPTEVVYFKPFKPFSSQFYDSGCPIAIVPVLRNAKAAMDPDIKSGNYLNNIIALLQKESVGAHECFMLNQDDLVTEGTTSNIFIVKAGYVLTPPTSFDILRGITRSLVLRLCREQKLNFAETGFGPDDVVNADEVFITSSTREIMPVSSVNGVNLMRSPGPITQKLRVAYQGLISEYCEAAHQKPGFKGIK